MRIVIIGNPISGGGSTGRRLDSLVRLLERDGHALEVCRTRGPGDGGRLARRLDGTEDALLVVGGDGTLNEVVNGMPDPGAVPLALLPTGTANLLAHDLGLSRRPEALRAVLAAGKTRRIDAGLANGRRFLAVASCGFDAEVAREVARVRGRRMGYLRYAGPIVRTLYRHRSRSLRVRVDDGAPVQGGRAVVSNTRNYGGLFVIADRARCDSGRLEVVVAERADRMALVTLGLRALVRRIGGARGLHVSSGRTVTIEAEPSQPFQVDGDYAGETPLSIEVLPRAVSVFAPELNRG